MSGFQVAREGCVETCPNTSAFVRCRRGGGRGSRTPNSGKTHAFSRHSGPGVRVCPLLAAFRSDSRPSTGRWLDWVPIRIAHLGGSKVVNRHRTVCLAQETSHCTADTPFCQYLQVSEFKRSPGLVAHGKPTVRCTTAHIGAVPTNSKNFPVSPVTFSSAASC